MNPHEYIDAHAHVNFPDYNADRADVIKRAQDAGVLMINVGTTLQSSRDVVKLAEENEGTYAIVGLHPVHVDTRHPQTGEALMSENPDAASRSISDSYSHDYMERFDAEAFEPLIAHPKTVAVGECGIDVYRLPEHFNNPEDRARILKLQEEDFRKQIELAVKYDKPIMIHARESYGDILRILDDCLITYGAQLRGNAHFFAGTTEEARAFIERGFTVSFTGVITFAKQYEELVRSVPLDRMLSETDCPFVAPVPFRGKRNEPLYVREVVARIAEIKGLDLDTVKKALLSNAQKQFKLVD